MTPQETTRVRHLKTLIGDLQEKKKQKGTDKKLINIKLMECKTELKNIRINADKRDFNLPDL